MVWLSCALQRPDVLMFFQDGVQFLARNGGAARPLPHAGSGSAIPAGQSGKCFNLEGDPGYYRDITITSTVWTYEW